MTKPILMIRQQINLGFACVLIMALLVIIVVVEFKVKPDLIEQQQRQVALNQDGFSDLLSANLGQIELLASTLALATTKLPKDEALFKQLFPSIIDNHGDPAIAGGGIWPEPGVFTEGVQRRSFFWGRSNGEVSYVDDYNLSSGSGYHNEPWYQLGRDAPTDRCSWSEAYIDPFTDTPMVTCTIPFHENDRFAGVATVDMWLGGITDILAQHGSENGGYAFAMDSTGQMISFPESAVQLEKADHSLISAEALGQKLPWLSDALTRAINLQGTAMIELPEDAILGEAAYVDLIKHVQTGWTIGLVVPKGRMTAAAESMGLFLMLAVGVLLMVVGIVAAILFRNLLHKIQQTTQQIQELTDGGTAQALETGAMNEIGALRRAVNAYGDKLKSLLRHLEDVKDELVQSEKLASLGALVSGVAHELNTPIGNALMSSTAIRDANRAFAEKLAQQVTRRELDDFIADVDEGAQIVERNMTRAAELIGAFKQLAVDQASSHRREFNLYELVKEVNLSMRPTLQRSPYRLEVDVPQTLYLDSYPGKLSQVLINLINNAVVHAFAGREEGCIRIVAKEKSQGWVSLSVSDNGCGIPVESRKRIFDPFYTTRLGQGGSGLGLHITFNLVTGVLGGRIDVSSTEGEGSCFTITVPVSGPEMTESTMRSAS
ncbi:sensor histidine kinase [Halomonas llamarensis]|uniref:histidine kinase n=1 Tax=Halomonas llamarensis TaxID=2945104 RepID=A0ABT0SSQ5_9GAMM|nr:sensor histidine kinase [Halomonas llamarensis]MCL7930766.1 sensor histidine kinase [Halomonas llamarensis]